MRNPAPINHFPPTLFSPNRSSIYERRNYFSQPAAELVTGSPALDTILSELQTVSPLGQGVQAVPVSVLTIDTLGGS
jgi:hypothetical protein